VIYKFYFTSASIPYLTQQLSIPTLPRDPPQFLKKPEMPVAQLPPPKERKPPAPKPKPPTTTQTYYHPPPPPPTADFYQTISSIGSITGDLLTFGFPGASAQPQQQPEVFMTSSQMQQYQQQFPTQQPANPFTTNTAANPFMTTAQGLSSAGLSNAMTTAPTTIYPIVCSPHPLSSYSPRLSRRGLLHLYVSPLQNWERNSRYSLFSAPLILLKPEKLSRQRYINWRASTLHF
jgi:hypothetical protein